MTNIKANDVVAGIHYYSGYNFNNCTDIKLTKNGLVDKRYKEESIPPTAYKVIEVDKNVATVQCAFFHGFKKTYELACKYTPYSKSFKMHITYLRPISYFTKNCIIKMMETVIGINDITQETINDFQEYNHKKLVIFFTDAYNEMYRIAKENIETTESKLKKYLEEQTPFEKLKKEIIQKIMEIEYSKDNEIYLEMANYSLDIKKQYDNFNS